MTGYYYNIILASKTTLSVALSSLSVGLLVGLLLSVAELGTRWLKPIVKLWTLLIRGLPEIVVLFFCYYGVTAILTKMAGKFIDVSPFESGVITLSIIFSAYASQIFIASYKAIPKGEISAGRALGLSYKTIFISIVLPQLFRHALPGLINLWLVLLKDSSIVSLIGLHDIMNTAHIAAAESFQPFNYYLFAGVLYLIMTAASTWIGKHLENHFSLEKAHA